jgi:hypothetical protein
MSWVQMRPIEPTPFRDTMQVCLNGHLITTRAQNHVWDRQEFCRKCGERTITQCEACEHPIPGYVDGSYAVDLDRPNFCEKCACAYPWTERAIRGAQQLADALDMLSEEERALLSGTIDDLVHENQQTAASAFQFKRLVAKAGHEVPAMMRDLLYAVVVDMARRAIWP